MAAPITYKRLVLSGDKAKETANEVKAKMSKEWKKDFPDGKLDIKDGVEGKMVIDIKTKDSSAASLASKIKDIAARNKVTVVTKDKPTLKAVKENIWTPEKALMTVFLKYKNKSFPMDYKPGSMFAKFIDDLTSTGYFEDEDHVSEFMSGETSPSFFDYSDKFNIDIDYADYDPSQLELGDIDDETDITDLTPGRASGDTNPDVPHRVTDLMEKLKKTGKLTKSELKEILLYEYKKK
jgi:hypothetical protein